MKSNKKNLEEQVNPLYFAVKEISFTYQDSDEEQNWYDEEEFLPAEDEELLPALSDISFSGEQGQCILITGPSGCGKSTLLNIINGIIPEFLSGEMTGDVLLEEKSLLNLPIDQRGSLVGSVFQNPRSQFFNVYVKDELTFGCENLNIPAEEIKRRVNFLVEKFGMKTYLERRLFELSGGEKQKVACLCIAAMEPNIILYDEPSSNLDQQGMKDLAELMAFFKDKGLLQIVSEHRLPYVSPLVDQVFLMEEGKISQRFSGDEFLQLKLNDLQQLGLRNTQEFPATKTARKLHLQAPAQKQADLTQKSSSDLYIENLQLTYDRKQGPLINMNDYVFEAAKVHALVGRNGIGKSSFLRSLCGLEKRAKGKIHFAGSVYSPRKFSAHCAVVFQDVNHQLLTESVYRELYLSLEDQELSEEEKEQAINSLARKLDLEHLLDEHPFSLSGGQKQRLAFATTILMEPELLLLDEPTSGLDLKHMLKLAELLHEYAKEHIVILASHDQELLQIIDPEIHELLRDF